MMLRNQCLNLNVDNYREDIVTILTSLENIIDIEKYVYRDFNYWLLVKTFLATKLELSAFRVRDKKSNDFNIEYFNYCCTELGEPAAEKVEVNSNIHSIKSIKSELSNIHNIIYSRSSRIDFDLQTNKYVNLDFKRHIFGPNTKFFEFVDNQSILTPRENENIHLFLDRKERLSNVFSKKHLFVIANLIYQLEKHGIPDEFLPNVSQVRQRIIDSENYASTFMRIMHATDIKQVFVSTYFDVAEGTSGLILACKRLNIKVIEYQHGLIGHTHWSHIPQRTPKKSLNLYPSELHYWENQLPHAFSKTGEINVLQPVKVKRHPLIIDKKNKKNHRKKILFVSQYGVGNIPKILKKLKDDQRFYNYDWLIRLHPLSRGYIGTFIKIFRYYNNVEIASTTLDSIEKIFSKVDVVFGSYSGTLIDAYELGLKSITVTDIGRRAFSSDIELGRIKYTENVDEFFNYIENELPPNRL